MARLTDAVSAAVRRPLPPRDRVRAEVTAVARTFAEDPAMARVMLVTSVGATPAADAAHRGMRAAAARVIEQQLEGYSYWRRRSPEQRHIAAVAAVGAVAEPVSELVAGGRIAEWQSVVDPITDLVAHGLLPRR
jgi:hypothetical protein